MEEVGATNWIVPRVETFFRRLMGELDRAVSERRATRESLKQDLRRFDDLLVDLCLRAQFSTAQDAEARLSHLEGLLDDQVRWTEQGNPMRTGPLFIGIALEDLKKAEAEFKAGSKPAMLLAISICAAHQLVMPDWLSDAFLASYTQVSDFEVRSLDEAFGKPMAKGKSAPAARAARKLRVNVLLAVAEAVNNGKPVGKELFEIVAKKLHLGTTRAEVLYYQSRRELLDSWRHATGKQ